MAPSKTDSSLSRRAAACLTNNQEYVGMKIRDDFVVFLFWLFAVALVLYASQ